MAPSSTFRPILACAALCLATAPALRAQSFNIDCGDSTGFAGVSGGVPTNAYGAAAAQPGFWNAPTEAQTPVYSMMLSDLAGTPTAVTTSVVQIGNSVGDFYFDNAGTTGDDAALLDDCMDIGNGGVASEATWTFTGIANGCYDIYVYAWAPDSATFVSFVQDPNGPPTQGTIVGGAWTGAHALGVTYAKFYVSVTTGSFQIRVTANGVGGNFASINGFQIVANSPLCFAGTPYCAGDGSGTACPCLNTGGLGRGCANSIDPAGGLLQATGTASVSADSIVLFGSGMPNATCLYFQGTTQSLAGIAFGDGLRCATGTVTRLGTKLNAAGASQYPAAGDPSVSVKGLLPPAGGLRSYQVWYRNAAAFCTISTFNLTNGLALTWVP